MRNAITVGPCGQFLLELITLVLAGSIRIAYVVDNSDVTVTPCVGMIHVLGAVDTVFTCNFEMFVTYSMILFLCYFDQNFITILLYQLLNITFNVIVNIVLLNLYT